MADLAVGDIIKNITDDVKLLVQDQIELAKDRAHARSQVGRYRRRAVRSRRILRASPRRSFSTSLPPSASSLLASQHGSRS